MPQSHTADQPTTQQTHSLTTPGRQLKQSNQLSLPHQDGYISTVLQNGLKQKPTQAKGEIINIESTTTIPRA